MTDGFGVTNVASRGVFAWAIRIFLGLAVGLLLRSILAAQSFASHPYPLVGGYHRHLKSMTGFENEVFCVNVTDAPGTDYVAARSRIAHTLYIDEPTKDWSGLKGNRIQFLETSEQCSQLPGISTVQLRFFIMNQLSAPGIAEPVGRVFNVRTGHTEAEKFYIDFRTQEFQDDQVYPHNHLINHETGHAFGLDDGGPGAPRPGPVPCQLSVMHDYGCPFEDWPTLFDRTTVSEMIPVASSTLGRSYHSFGP